MTLPLSLRRPAKIVPPIVMGVKDLQRPGSAAPDETGQEPPAEFLRDCDEQDVLPAHRAALWRLARRWHKPGLGEAELRMMVLEDHAHWRLFAASRDGDGVAARDFDQFWRGYVRAFLAGRFTVDQIEEITSTFFARLYRLVTKEFDWHCPFAIYVRAVLVNVSRDEAKRLAISRERERRLEDHAESGAAGFASREPGPEALALAAEREEALERALAELKPLDRHIVRACLVDGESGQDLARELGMSRDALYQRLHRAKARLKQAIEREGLRSDRPGRGV